MQHYPQYPHRRILDLDGFWEFAWLGDADWSDVTPAAFRPQTIMAVPGVFDTLPAYAQTRGIGVYRKRLPDDFECGERLQLRIGGMGLFGRLWFDGEFVGDCHLPYSSVAFDLDVGARQPHELVIAVDNRFDPERMPLFLPDYDFYAYGGLYRSVSLHRLPACSIDRVQVAPLDLRHGTVSVRVRLQGQVPGTCTLSVSMDGGSPQSYEAIPEDGQIQLELAVPGFRVWSPDAPHLHTVEVAIADDAVRERFGLRTIEARDQQLLLNGEPLELRGFNRHEAHPQLGPTQTPALMLEDLQWIKYMNGNFVRCVHYPQDDAFFDLCDEMGLLVWTESLGWGNRAAQLADQRFGQFQEMQTRLMVRNSCNHPSIIFWAFLNEAESDSEAALPLYDRLVRAIREEDSSRLVSYASNRGTRDRCFELVDVIALNAYPGWIAPVAWDTPSAEAVAPFVNGLTAHFTGASPLAKKPLLFTEIGACALYGCHDLARSEWTEEFQADYMAEAARVILENPRTCGVTLWQLFDTRSYGPAGQVRTKPRGYNNAGVLDEYRRPKLACAAVRNAFRSRGGKDSSCACGCSGPAVL